MGTGTARIENILRNLKFDHNKHHIEQFLYGLKVLGKMIGTSDRQVIESKRPFHKNDAQLLETDDIHLAIGKGSVLVLLIEPKLP